MKVDTDAVVTRLQSLTPLATKTFKLVAPRDAQGKLPTAPYVVVQPSDGDDTQERVTGPTITRHPRFTLQIVGSSYDNAQSITELVKPLFIVNGRGIQIDVAGEKGSGLWWSGDIPTQVDNDVTPPLIYNTVELGWTSDPA